MKTNTKKKQKKNRVRSRAKNTDEQVYRNLNSYNFLLESHTT